MLPSLSRREFLVAGAALAACAEPTAPKRPNILFIFDDQLRADACSVYGGVNISTPNIDKLAYQGVRFTNAFSTYPLCTPYRGMLQTGKYPTHSGIFCNWTDTNTAVNDRCLAHAFADAGYQTGFIGKWHLAAGARKYDDLFVDPYNGDYAAREADGDPFPNPEFVPPGPARLGYEHWEAYNFHVSFNNYWFYRDEGPPAWPHSRFESAYSYDDSNANTALPGTLCFWRPTGAGGNSQLRYRLLQPTRLRRRRLLRHDRPGGLRPKREPRLLLLR